MVTQWWLTQGVFHDVQWGCSGIIWDIQPTYIYIYERSAKTSIEKCDLGAKLSFLGLHYIVLQYILIASSASPGKLHAESLFTPPLRVLGIFDCPALSFPALQLYGGCGVIPANATANHSCTILSPAQKQALNSVCWRKPGWALTATCSMPFIHSPASAQQTIDLVQRLCLGYLHLG